MAAGSPRVRFLSLKFREIRVCPLHYWDEKLNDTAIIILDILSFGFFNYFYVFSIFIIPRIILTTTHTHRTYHIMKIYNNLVQWGNGSANDQMFLKTRKMQRIKMFPFPYWLLWIYITTSFTFDYLISHLMQEFTKKNMPKRFTYTMNKNRSTHLLKIRWMELKILNLCHSAVIEEK